MKTRVSYFLSLCVVLWGTSGCRKVDDPVVVEETPVFTLNGFLNGVPLNITAGKDHYYLFSEYENDSTVLEFKGTYKRTCASCKEALSISIRNFQTGFVFDPDSSIGVGAYPYYDAKSPDSLSYEVRLTNNSSGSGTPSHAWAFGDGTFSTAANPVKVYDKAGTYQITYVVSYSNGCSSDIGYPVHISAPGVLKIPTFTYTHLDTMKLEFKVDTPAVATTWDFGDATSGTGNTVSHTYAAPGSYKVCMLKFNGSDTASVCKNVSTLNFNSCKANFVVSSSQVIPKKLHLSEVTVTYHDPNGSVYTSRNIKQHAGAYFEILSSAPYVLNEQGQKTYRIRYRLSCLVTDGSDTLTLNNVTGEMAVAIP